jgi:hypothetical protein
MLILWKKTQFKKCNYLCDEMIHGIPAFYKIL